MDLNYIDPSRELRPHLGSFEQLEWSGRPKQGLRIKPGDKFMIPFSLLWGGFAIFWELMAYTMGAPIFFMLFGIPFVLIGLYLIFGRFIFSAVIRKNTYYGLTNDRVICLSGKKNKNVKSVDIKSIGNISYTEKPDGSGTITFGSSIAINNEREKIQRKGFSAGFSFELIPDVKRVYSKIMDLKRKTDE